MSTHNARVSALGGYSVNVVGSSICKFSYRNLCLKLPCFVLDVLLQGVDMIMGMDWIRQLGGVIINDGVKFIKENSSIGNVSADECKSSGDLNVLSIDDSDFKAKFNGTFWTVEWKWKNEPPEVQRSVSNYKIKPNIQDPFEAELQTWITNGWLIPAENEKYASIPVMAVEQINKSKVRPVLDFRELNKHVVCNTADSVVCDETIRSWRNKKGNLAILDLSKAYLQLHVSKGLWKYQVIGFKGKRYYLCRLGFGLSSAPRIMNVILRKVLSLDPEIKNGTSNYIDDIIVDQSIVSVEKVRAHLRKFGLECKASENFENAKVLGLRIHQTEDGNFKWSRSNCLPIEILEKSKPSKREIFSVCGKIVGHYPVAGWLRVACSFLKRVCEGTKWDEYAGDRACKLLRDLLIKLQYDDPVGGVWYASPNGKVEVWCDASSIAYGVSLYVDDNLIEDAAWLRKSTDHAHINVSELEAVIRGINLAIKWKYKKISLFTDSATVFGWIKTTLTGSNRIKTHGAAEMLIKRRLSIIEELKESFRLEIDLKFVNSEKNKADVLTRVHKTWLDGQHEESEEDESDETYEMYACPNVARKNEETNINLIRKVHKNFHGGLNKTKHVLERLYPTETFSTNEIKGIIRDCTECSSIDPHPIKWEEGHLSCEFVWDRIAVDVTHYNNKKYLSIIDCGPSRFAVWKNVKDESFTVVSAVIVNVFKEYGPPNQILLDNFSTFVSSKFENIMKEWNVKIHYRCVHKPTGNSIVERNHRTIKQIAARAKIDIEKAVYWYNALPNKEGNIPGEKFFNRQIRYPGEISSSSTTNSSCCQDSQNNYYKVGDKVFVKPSQYVRCTEKWNEGIVTNTKDSGQSVEVDGLPRHVSHVRSRKEAEPCKDLEDKSKLDFEAGPYKELKENNNLDSEWTVVGAKGRPVRRKHPPDRYF